MLELRMGDRLFTIDDAWHGGFYELCLELGPRSDARLDSAFTALWQHPALVGCYLDSDREPGEQQRVVPDHFDPDAPSRGVARLPNGSSVACTTCVVREDTGSDWLYFCIPIGSLATVYSIGGFPAGDESEWAGHWRSELEEFLADIGRSIGRVVNFRLGLIGWEVSATENADELAVQGIPTERYLGYLWPAGERVEYFPRTID